MLNQPFRVRLLRVGVFCFFSARRGAEAVGGGGGGWWKRGIFLFLCLLCASVMEPRSQLFLLF